jgi:hypothetical protein
VQAPVAQLDRASAFGAEGWEFESLRAHHVLYRSYAEKPLKRRLSEHCPYAAELLLGFLKKSTISRTGNLIYQSRYSGSQFFRLKTERPRLGFVGDAARGIDRVKAIRPTGIGLFG